MTGDGSAHKSLVAEPDTTGQALPAGRTASPLSELDIFWAEIAPCEHVVQIYEEDRAFLDTLEGFVRAGLRAGDSVIVIASHAHLHGLGQRLVDQDINVAAALASDQYIPLDAEEALSQFVVNGWPDEDRFRHLVSGLLTRGRAGGRRVRAFGEMVAVMWARGEQGATVRLEHLWHRLCQSEAFSLFCAYPRIGFTQDAEAAIGEICKLHSRVVSYKPPAPR